MNKTRKLVIINFLIMAVVINCQLISLSNVDASNPKIGIDINDSGIIAEENIIIKPSTEVIYFQFDLIAPDNMQVSLDFKWYYDTILIAEYSDTYFQGLTTATLRRDKTGVFLEGLYRVEVWFLNTLLIKDFFSIIS